VTFIDKPPYRAAQQHYDGPRCVFCDGPVPHREVVHVKLWPDDKTDRDADRACWNAYRDDDTETLAARRRQACEAGFHRYPGRWVADPSDPYGDAVQWKCAKDCGYVRWSPGMGTNRFLAEHGVTGEAS
jgi:hypothetical protein